HEIRSRVLSSFRRALPFALLSLLALSAASAQPTKTRPAAAPAPSMSDDQLGKASTAPHAMVAAANPMAVEAGLRVLKAGGDAMDAAVAVQATLGLVEPQSSGLGGGACMTYNGRETAPAGATPDMFLGPDGRPMNKGQAMISSRSAGVPGAIAMLYMAHS